MGLIPEDVIAQVLDRSDIVEVISSYIPLKRAGRNFKALSPFTHEKTPSFIVSPDKQIFHCFSTGQGGNVISFVMQMEHVSFPQALRILADKVGVTVPDTRSSSTESKNLKKELFEVNRQAVDYFCDTLLCDKSQATVEARNYLKGRGLDLETVKLFQLGFAPDSWDGLIDHLRAKNVSLAMMEKAGLIVERNNKEGYYDRFRGRIIFPIFDSFGNAIAFGARTLADDQAKYINSPETYAYTKGRHLYGMHLAKHAIAKLDYAIIVEGYLDCITPRQADIENIVASCGTALTIEQIRSVKRFTRNVVLLFDTDSAGVAAMIRSLDLLIEEEMNVKIAVLDEGADPDSFVKNHGKEEFLKKLKDAKSVFAYKFDYLTNKFDINSVEARAKIVAEMLAMISKFENEVIRVGYIEELARKLRVNKEVIVQEFNKLVQGDKRRQAPVEQTQTKAPKQKTIPAEERNILSLMLTDQKFITQARADLSIDEFQDERIGTIVKKIYELFDQNLDLNNANLFDAADPSITDLISELIFEAEDFVGDKDKIYADCLGRIKRQQKNILSESLNLAIKEAEANKDMEKVYELLRQKNQLSGK